MHRLRLAALAPLLTVLPLACGGAAPRPCPASPAVAAASPAPSAPSPVVEPDLRAKLAPALAAIRPEALSAHVRYLADDALEGRGTGARGFDVASAYVASELQAVGVAPAGEGGTYFQSVPLRAVDNDQSSNRFVVTKGGARLVLSAWDDFVLASDLDQAEAEVTAPLVFVGYGVAAPEYKYDDFEGVDVKGKIAIVFRGAPLSAKPEFFPSTEHAYYSDTENKVRRLLAKGAVGVVVVDTPDDEARYPWSFVQNQYHFESMDFMEGAHPGKHAAGMPLRAYAPTATLQKVLAFAGAKPTLDDLVTASKTNQLIAFDLGASATLHRKSAFRALTSRNVVGVIRGKDPRVAREHVVFTAHLDHLGVGKPVNGDSIYNGADDDASGVSTVLEIARAFSALPEPPARSVVFLLTTGEERGLLGAAYFAAHSTLGDGVVVADINIDGNCPSHEVFDVVALGAEHSSFAAPVAAAASAFGLATSPDPDPDFNAFIRSDQYEFVKQGVPSIFIFEGLKDEKGATATNAAKEKARAAKRYHEPADEWDPTLDYAQAAKMARVDFTVGWLVAQSNDRPKWNPGDFYARFAR